MAQQPDNTQPVPIDPKSIKWDDLSGMQLSNKHKTALRAYMLNQPPPGAWIKTHPLYGNKYVPIDKVEYLLTIFFGKFRVEIKSVFQIVNSVCVTIRLFYMNPDTNEYDWQDGGGAAPMQVDSGSKATNIDAIKSNAVMLALPIAETNAVKDAADKIGLIFGRDLNRKNTLDYEKLADENKFKNAQIVEK